MLITEVKFIYLTTKKFMNLTNRVVVGSQHGAACENRRATSEMPLCQQRRTLPLPSSLTSAISSVTTSWTYEVGCLGD